MHLYAIRQPEMDAVFHLHPDRWSRPAICVLTLPGNASGQYRLYADIVHANGFPETLTAEVIVPPNLTVPPLAAEDASARRLRLVRVRWATPTSCPTATAWPGTGRRRSPQIPAYQLSLPLARARRPPATDMRPYLGMAGHAAFVKTDGTVFAHTHPEGSAAMQAMMLANGRYGRRNEYGPPGRSPTPVEFPYGFPKPGRLSHLHSDEARVDHRDRGIRRERAITFAEAGFSRRANVSLLGS